MNLGYSTQKQIYGASGDSDGNDNRELYRVKSTHILELFPDELIVEEKTVSIVRRQFLSTYIETLPLDDILESTLTEAGPYATIRFMDKARKETFVNNLPKAKAEKVKRLIDGLLTHDDSILQSHKDVVNQYA